MSTFRFQALQEFSTRRAERFYPTPARISDSYGVNVFDQTKMKKYLSSEAFEVVRAAVEEGKKIDRRMADQIAAGMKTWALERGATHYTHWFHPLTDATAEKHEAFIEPVKGGGAVENFRGDLLVQQEPDASSFPNGGLRNTFEARGYTAWDPSSPAFIIEDTLCVPSIFVSYTGEALDHKTPHLKSLQELEKAAVKVCQYFDKNVTRVQATLGLEQEYFVVDSALYRARPDLMQTDRTLMGHTAAKNQQLEDHYFAAIPSRVMAFMKDFEVEAYKLGVPLKTRHNEVAPNQFEFAPVYTEANLAVDHNQMMIILLRRIAKRHKLKVIFHEKPFGGVNGSGKHCNWSLRTDTDVNLLSPGKTPRNNLQFLTFFVATIRAVYEHHYLLMSSIMSLNNSHRLGANEAPPAVMSIFVGKTLSKVLDEIEQRVSDKKMTADEKTTLKLDVVGKIPEILPDNTDRNRTSPFAFTGNRFEFRAVGSSANVGFPSMVLNAAVTQQLKRFSDAVDKLIAKGVKKDEAIFQVLRTFIKESKTILFEGNGYSSEWVKEANKRGLRAVKDVPSATDAFLESGAKKLFEELNLFTEKEIEARHEIQNEAFVKKLQIEARVLGDLAINHIIPTAIRYQNLLIENLQGLKDIYSKEEYAKLTGPQIDTLRIISSYIIDIKTKVTDMIEARKKANTIEDISKRAVTYSKTIIPYMQEIRDRIDHLEIIVDDELWPLPKYRELLFLR
ncbi:MAG: glutamine synthetase III [Prevotellaceae bacterium]|jgi:glutamine synthetase|nr:glutamine synthetase III [Prevotellaceae bacterium]